MFIGLFRPANNRDSERQMALVFGNEEVIFDLFDVTNQIICYLFGE